MKSNKKATVFAFAVVALAFSVLGVSCRGEKHNDATDDEAGVAYKELDNDTIPFKAQVSAKSLFQIRTVDSVTYFCDIIYPETSAHLYCTYRGIDKADVRQLTYEAERMVSFHSKVAMSIEKIPVRNSYGVSGALFELRGDVATPYQLALTDSCTFFFNASLYFDDGSHAADVPEKVSAMRHDIDKLIYTFVAVR